MDFGFLVIVPLFFQDSDRIVYIFVKCFPFFRMVHKILRTDLARHIIMTDIVRLQIKLNFTRTDSPASDMYCHKIFRSRPDDSTRWRSCRCSCCWRRRRSHRRNTAVPPSPQVQRTTMSLPVLQRGAAGIRNVMDQIPFTFSPEESVFEPV